MLCGIVYYYTLFLKLIYICIQKESLLLFKTVFKYIFLNWHRFILWQLLNLYQYIWYIKGLSEF